MSEARLGSWQARLLRRASGRDVAALSLIVALAVVTIVCGRMARLRLEPRSALEAARMLDELELPARLPDAPLADPEGSTATLLERIHEGRAIVAFYAPWCGPCQKELPLVAAAVKDDAQLIVVVSADEDLEATRRQLANIGLAATGFTVDITGQLSREGRVTALPTTFLVNRHGGVLARGTGFSQLALAQLRRKLSSREHGATRTADGGTP
jgi:thiol-disulfide isomerase/thioredoxin